MIRIADAWIGMNMKRCYSTVIHSVYLSQAQYWERCRQLLWQMNNWKFPKLHGDFFFLLIWKIFFPTGLFCAYLVTAKEQGNSMQLFLRPDGWGRKVSREADFCNLPYESMLWAELCQEFYGLVLCCTLTFARLPYPHKKPVLSKQ